MGFTEAVRTVLTQKYATFSGRASRSEYWWFQLFYLLLALAMGILAFTAGAFSGGEMSSPLIVLALIGGLLALGLALPIIALQVRRFHDRNMSGWWYLAVIILGMVPVIGRVSGIVITVISVMKGTEGPNKFGPDPLRPDARAEVFA